jgi:hypothetical protein
MHKMMHMVYGVQINYSKTKKILLENVHLTVYFIKFVFAIMISLTSAL